jgi:hypothetical protein
MPILLVGFTVTVHWCPCHIGILLLFHYQACMIEVSCEQIARMYNRELDPGLLIGEKRRCCHSMVSLYAKEVLTYLP